MPASSATGAAIGSTAPAIDLASVMHADGNTTCGFLGPRHADISVNGGPPQRAWFPCSFQARLPEGTPTTAQVECQEPEL